MFFSASYNSQNRNTAWSYDVDGRLISMNEDPPNAMTYSPLINTYNAAGQLGSWAQTLTRAPGGVTQTTATTRNQTYDGNGKLVKTAVTQQVNSALPTTTNTYYLISSVTGTAIAEYNGAGIKSKASVYAGGAVIAQQLTSDTSPTMVFAHVNPLTGDGLNTTTSSVVWDRTAPDPDGANTGDTNPFVSNIPDDPNEASQSAIDARVAQLVPGWGSSFQPKCVVNGALSACGWVGSLLQSGGFGVEYTLYSRRHGGFHTYVSPIDSLGGGLYGNVTPPTSIRYIGDGRYTSNAGYNLFSFDASQAQQQPGQSAAADGRNYKSNDCFNKVMGYLAAYAKSELGKLSEDAGTYVHPLLSYMQDYDADPREVTFALANAYHETRLFQALTESEESARQFGYDPKYRGRGYIGLTKEYNYGAMAAFLGANAVRLRLDTTPLLAIFPDAAADPKWALPIMTAYFLTRGTYAYLNKSDYLGARRTINPRQPLSEHIGGPKGPTISERILGLTGGLEPILRDCQ